MDGSEEKVLVDGKFRSIIALAVDESISRLYGMTQKEIFSVSFYGGNSEVRGEILFTFLLGILSSLSGWHR